MCIVVHFHFFQVCVEAAQVIPPVSLAKGEKWTGKQVLAVLPL